MKIDFNNKNVRDAILIAELAHKNQIYDNVFPYIKHIYDVVDVLLRFGYSEDKYIISGILHDSLEDDSLSYNNIKKHFGEEIAEIVFCLTDELGRNRKEKKEKTYPKLLNNKVAIVVKLADRIANLEHGGKNSMYLQEYFEFKKILFIVSKDETQKMWDHIESLLGIIPDDYKLTMDNFNK